MCVFINILVTPCSGMGLMIKMREIFYKFDGKFPKFISTISLVQRFRFRFRLLPCITNMFQVFAFLLILSVSTSVSCSDNSIERDYFENVFTLGDERENDRNAMKSAANKWPHGVIPYRFDESYIERDRACILHAMEVFRQETCIKFLFKRSNQSEYIQFKKSDSGCGTLVGYKGKESNPIDVFLSEKCLNTPGAIQHELLHVIGLWHEQSRPDRDEYVDIIFDNIQPSNLVFFF